MSSTPLRPDSNGSGDRPVADVTLIDAMLALTPEERLRQNDRMLASIQELRHGLAAEPHQPPRRPGGQRG